VTPGDVLTAVLLPLGAGFAALGALGLARFPDILARLHAVAKPQTLGILLILAGTAPQLPGAAAAPLLLVALFQLITAPIVAQTLGRVASATGELRRERLVVDERASLPKGPRG
jgi:multicomponent Na+:H+ antiporter subunit G